MTYTQVIKVNCHDMDPYYATGVCCEQVLTCREHRSHSNVLIKLITNSYNLKFKYKSLSIKSKKVLIPQHCPVAGVLRCCATAVWSCVEVLEGSTYYFLLTALQLFFTETNSRAGNVIVISCFLPMVNVDWHRRVGCLNISVPWSCPLHKLKHVEQEIYAYIK
jgi:hypothetical protein